VYLQGAAAILEYHTIDSPLAQPRSAMLGQIFSATIGIGITKLFLKSPHFVSLRWLAGALSVGLASAFMGLTKTVHPPAGATALLCATDPTITALGWFFLPMILLGTTLLLAVALLLNNIQRQFPIYWWTPADLDRPTEDDIERLPSSVEEKSEEGEVGRTSSSKNHDMTSDERITIGKDHITVPDWIALEYEERAMLEILRTKLRKGRMNRPST
jgi:CBS-domain-containing membrane protein